MRSALFHGAAAMLLVSGTVRAADLPTAVSLERYQSMLDKSPFAIASETAPPPQAESPGFAKDLILTGVARMGENTFICVASKNDPTQRFAILSGESYNGISVASVAWSDAIGKTKVTLKKGSEFGVIGYDEALLAAAAQGGTPAGAVQPPPGGRSPQPPASSNITPNNNGGIPPGAQQPPRSTVRRSRILTPQK